MKIKNGHIEIRVDKFLKKDSLGNWNTIPPIPADKVGDVNCHKFVLYVIGKISLEEMISDARMQKDAGADFTFGETARSISNIPFTPVKTLESLFLFANENCEIGKDYVGQILDVQTEEMAHSFIVQREPSDQYICFDKPGFKYPFAVSDLETVLNFVNKDGEKSNQNQNWRFMPLDLV
ncbi:MAG: hypothetical protein HYT46_01245 [Candidatus Vogelbacteria bacterium]|nr:hypothetical protein [Candidatus Vogelbacteria bacterium]